MRTRPRPRASSHHYLHHHLVLAAARGTIIPQACERHGSRAARGVAVPDGHGVGALPGAASDLREVQRSVKYTGAVMCDVSLHHTDGGDRLTVSCAPRWRATRSALAGLSPSANTPAMSWRHVSGPSNSPMESCSRWREQRRAINRLQQWKRQACTACAQSSCCTCQTPPRIAPCG
jgi:hypothetical protein